MTEANPNQRTYEWFQDRCGCLTASQAAAIFEVSKRDGKPLKAYSDLLWKLVSERATGQPVLTFTSSAMQWGTDTEPAAIDAYMKATGNVVEQVGFVPHREVPWFGASPDGVVVGKMGLIEVKCPNTQTHLQRIVADVVPEEYKVQMQVQILCTGKLWVDYVDYDPRIIDPKLQLFIKRYTPTREELEKTMTACINFLNEVQARVSAFDAKFFHPEPSEVEDPF